MSDHYPLPDEDDDALTLPPDEGEMSDAPLKDPPPRRVRTVKPRRNPLPYNLVTLVMLLLTCSLVVYIGLIWQNPYSTLNPLAPPTLLPRIVTATLTVTPTLTPTETRTPSRTPTPSETFTPAPTATFTAVFIEGFSTPFGTPPAEPVDYPYVVQNDRLIYLTNPDGRGACRWSSIAGSVVDANGVAVEGYGIRIVGEGVDQTIATGSSPGFGPGGFELPLGTTAQDAVFIAQLLDATGFPASPVYTVETRADCTQNIAAMRFVPR